MVKKSQRIWIILAGLFLGVLAVFVMPKTKEKELHAADLTINTTLQLEQFRNNVNSGNDYLGQTIELSADIDLSGVASWSSIGTVNHPFKGTFDGKGYVISGMKVNMTENTNDIYAGFFGSINNAKIKNIGIVDSSISSRNSSNIYAGSLAGQNNGSTISDSYFMGTITAENTGSGNIYAGGLVGQSSGGTISNCYSVENLEVSGLGNNYVGKLVGKQLSGTVTNSYYLSSSEITTDNENTTIDNTATLSGTNSKTAAKFKSGEVACLLNGNGNIENGSGGTTWYQSIDNGKGPDSYPVLKNTHGTVYYTYKNGETTKSYTNTTLEATNTNSRALTETSHDFTDGTGFCANCGAYQKCSTETATNPGSASNPYLIENAGQLYWFAAVVNGELDKCEDSPARKSNACGKLLNDIAINNDINSENAKLWSPIGHYNGYTYRYTGSFDGDGHTISGMKVNMTGPWTAENYTYAGLFGYANCQVLNLTIENSSVNVDVSCTRCFAGGLCGNSEGGTFTNCNVDCNVNVKNSASNNSTSAGVLFGIISGDADNCVATGNVKIYSTESKDSSAGVFSGLQKIGTINNSYSTGNAEIISQGGENSAGGFVGRQNLGTINNSYSTGNVIVNNNSSNSSRVYAGGFIGRLVNVSTIENSHSNGNVTINTLNSSNTGEIQVGGFASCCKGGTFSKCYSTGSVSVEGYGNIRSGGFIGQVETACNISNCYAQGNVAGASLGNGSNHKSGGFVGNMWANEVGTKSITKCYASGSLTIDNKRDTYAGNFKGSGDIDEPNSDLYCSDFPIIKNGSGNLIEDTTGTKKSVEVFASGEVTYLLNGSKSEAEVGETLVWYQSLDNELSPHDPYPVFDSSRGIVYCGYVDCINKGYSNRSDVPLQPGEHNFTEASNGFCTRCGKYQPCTTVSEDNSGSVSNPYLIENAGQLYWFAAVVNNELDKCAFPPAERNTNACAKLIKNIEINTEEEMSSENTRLWTPIGQGYGDATNMYKGVFDGNSKTISGIKVDLKEGAAEICTLGLFGSVSESTIKNVGVKKSDVYAEDLNSLYAGGLVGYAYNSTIVNSYTDIDITCDGNEVIAGGFVGAQCEGGAITNCYSTGNITAEGSEVVIAGGFAGEQLLMSNNQGCSISNIYAMENIAVDGLGQKNVGKLIGEQTGNFTPTVTYAYYSGASSLPIGDGITVLTVGAEKTADEFENFAVKDLLQGYVNGNSSVSQPLLSWVQAENNPEFSWDSHLLSVNISWGTMMFENHVNPVSEDKRWTIEDGENVVTFVNKSDGAKLRYTAEFSCSDGVSGVTGEFFHSAGDWTYEDIADEVHTYTCPMVNSSEMAGTNLRTSTLALSGAPIGIDFSHYTDESDAVQIGTINLTISG